LAKSRRDANEGMRPRFRSSYRLSNSGGIAVAFRPCSIRCRLKTTTQARIERSMASMSVRICSMLQSTDLDETGGSNTGWRGWMRGSQTRRRGGKRLGGREPGAQVKTSMRRRRLSQPRCDSPDQQRRLHHDRPTEKAQVLVEPRRPDEKNQDYWAASLRAYSARLDDGFCTERSSSAGVRHFSR